MWCSRYIHQRIGTGTGGHGNKKTSEDHPNYSIIEIGQDTEKSPGHLKRFAVTQIPVKNSKRSKIISECRKQIQKE